MSVDLIKSGQLGLGYHLEKERHDALRAASVNFLSAADDKPLQFFDPRPVMWLPSQGPMGSCCGHSGATIAQLLNYFATGQIVRMSRLWCYHIAQIADGGMRGDTGASIEGFGRGAKEKGVPREETDPYPNPVVYTTRDTAAAAPEGLLHLIRNSQLMTDLGNAQRWVGHRVGGIHIGIPWTNSLANLRGKGATITRAMCQDPSVLGGHALAIVGLSPKLDRNGQPHFELANSHSRDWGDEGCALVETDAYLWWRDHGCALNGLTDMQAYEYRVPVSRMC